MKRLIRETIIIILIIIPLALITNALRPAGIELKPDQDTFKSQFTVSKHIKAISFERAIRKFHSGKALFLDARSPDDYKQGHIRDAVNLPDYNFDEFFDTVIERLERTEEIITYCDGEDCHLGPDLAEKLYDLGFKNVSYLANGWTLWRENSLPIFLDTDESAK